MSHIAIANVTIRYDIGIKKKRERKRKRHPMLCTILIFSHPHNSGSSSYFQNQYSAAYCT